MKHLVRSNGASLTWHTRQKLFRTGKSALVIFALGCSQAALLAQGAPAKVDASAPIPKRANPTFYASHAEFLKRSKEPMDLLFIGDSITAGWAKAPAIWTKYYGEWKPANFGIGGDQTQHVIWRIEDGELDGVKPKVAVLMLGTNNTGAHTAEDITAANTKIVRMIQQKIPGVKVLLLAIFPRGPRVAGNGVPDAWEKRMEIIHAVNKELAKLEDGSSVRFLNINEKFLGADGKIPADVMPDQLHPNEKGYQIWADAMHPLLTEMMK
jgi:lysophospholipase L1-like esterase